MNGKLKSTAGRGGKLLSDTYTAFMQDGCPQKAAGLSFYAVLSLPPMLLLVMILLGQVIDRELVRGELQEQIRLIFGSGAANQVVGVLKYVQRPAAGGGITAIIGVITFLFAAVNGFAQLQLALNAVWSVKPNPNRNPIKVFLVKRLFSFGVVLAVAALLLVSMLISTLLSALGDWVEVYLPGAFSQFLLLAVSVVVNYSVIAGALTLVFKVIPDVEIHWRDALLGGMVTTGLFLAGKWVISLYIGHSDPGTAYGAAGSLIVLLIWIYLSSMLLLLGAEFTSMWALDQGREIMPEKKAVRVRHIVEGSPSPVKDPEELPEDYEDK